MKKHFMFLIFIFFLISVSSVFGVDYFYEPMNFYESTTHTFEINSTGTINISLPPSFSLLSGNLTGNDTVSFSFSSPSLSTNVSELFTGNIYLNGSLYEDYYLLYIDPIKIVDTKVEVGHGDFNYIDGDGFIGTDNTLLFNLVRIWGVGTDIIDESATNVSFNCTYPLIIPNTVDSKYTTTYNSTNVVASGSLGRLDRISMFRIFALSQEVNQDANTTYQITCSDLTYDFEHTRITAEIEGFNLSVRSTSPLSISMANNSAYITYSILNSELYDLKDLELIWTFGTDTIREELGSLDSGDMVTYDISTNESGNVSLKVRFIPEWMFNSRSPTFYEQTEFDTYYSPEYLDGLNTSEFYNNQSVDYTPIFETQQMGFSINILQNAPYGGAYKVSYLFYDAGGVLIDTVERQILGVEDHLITFSSGALNPPGIEGDYDVYTIVSIQDLDGEWYDFDREFIGVQTIASLTDNGARPQIGYYDVIVNTRSDRYIDEDKITADITIKNTGDHPDEDTILTYYLINPEGKKYGETKEQILEVPPGSTTLTRSITLPLGSSIGEWRFEVEYETVVQPEIQVYDSFEVITGWTFFEGVGRNMDDYPIWNFITGFFLIFFVLAFYFLNRRKRKK